jgi:2-polyprenyl-3-methyl-5-hydroxy-6-metoxy-1,4-benzoquinol methylase
MNDTRTDDAVGHFTDRVTEFHSLYQHRPEFQERLEIWSELLDEYTVPGGLAIDMGCGTGVFTFQLAAKSGRVFGIDGAPDMVRFCEQQRVERGVQHVTFMQARLPVIDETRLAGADLIISSSVVEYVPDLDGTLALFARLLKPNGVLLLSMPNVWCISRIGERLKYVLTGQPELYRHILHFTSVQRLQKRVRRFGLTLERARHYSHHTRVAKFTRMLGLPLPLTEDLLVAALRKRQV